MENRCVGMGAPQNLCLAPTFLSVTLCHFQAAMKGQVANTGTVAVRSWGKLPSPVLVGLCERGVRGPCLLCPSAFSPRALGSALKRVPVAEGPSHPARGVGGGADHGRCAARPGAAVSRRPPALRRSPQPCAASAAPPPSHDLPASAATARAQRNRRGQNSNLFPNE